MAVALETRRCCPPGDVLRRRAVDAPLGAWLIDAIEAEGFDGEIVRPIPVQQQPILWLNVHVHARTGLYSMPDGSPVVRRGDVQPGPSFVWLCENDTVLIRPRPRGNHAATTKQEVGARITIVGRK